MEKKQHPLDEWVGKKLRDHEVIPREAAWEKLQARLPQSPESRKRPLWGYWAVAASVAALVLAGVWIGQRGEEPKQGATLADAPATAQPPTRRVPGLIDEVPGPEPASGNLVVPQELAARPTQGARAEQYPLAKPGERAGTESLANRQPRVEVEPTQPGGTESMVPTIPAVVPQVAQAQRVPAEQPRAGEVTASVFVVHVTEPPVLAQALEVPPAVQDAAVALTETGKPKKGKFFNRMVKNLQHLKQGEWKEAGLDANGLLARAEEKLLHK